ncbi:acetyltransferase [Dyella ginsengisoli]|uniref:Acetyltransferase n=1 Tax=Dyella ginsengisoli TaxID=363848 RepID=A0ABW8JS37_9GAMM
MACNPFHNPTPEFTKLYIFGAGGFGREVAWLAEQSWAHKVDVEFLVDIPNASGLQIDGRKVKQIADVTPDSTARIVIAVGDSSTRRRISALCEASGFREAIMVHPRAEMSNSVELGSGTIICAGAILTTNVHVGRHVHINLDCTIGHDAVIGDFATLSPGVHVSGHVHIGQGAFIGTGANLINGSADAPLVIGDRAVIAAGACVTKSVDCGALVAGVPATRKR